MSDERVVVGDCPTCCKWWWCLHGTPVGCLSVRLYTVEGDPPCPDCTGPSVGGPDDPHKKVYTICPDGSGGYAGDGATFYEDPGTPGDWLLEVCGFTFRFVAWPGVPGTTPEDPGNQGGPVVQGGCTTNGAATIFRNKAYCYRGSPAELLDQIAIVEAAGIYNYYGYSGTYDTEAECLGDCSGASMMAVGGPPLVIALSRPAVRSRPAPRPLPCLHLGRVLDRADASGRPCLCVGKWLHACDLHGSCTRVDGRDGTACCRTCGDYLAQETAP